MTEERSENGNTSNVQYGVQYTISVSNYPTDKNQVKVRIPAGTLTDKSGNTNEDTDIIIYNTLRPTAMEGDKTSRFLGNASIERQNIDNVTFLNNIPTSVFDISTKTYKDSTAWDVSAAQDKSIIAWYQTNANGTLKVYIASEGEISANVDSSYLFAEIGSSDNCTSTETITNIGLLNTTNVTNMNSMFKNTGYRAMTSLNLGDKFDTSNVTDMSYMFFGTGYTAMTSLDLEDKFDTSNVTNMEAIFMYTGYTAMTELNLESKFNTSNVITMEMMFDHTGYTALKTLDLGSNFDTSKVKNMGYMFQDTGYTLMESLKLGDKFDTSNVQKMSSMFNETGVMKLSSLDLGDKFYTSKVTSMTNMFRFTGNQALLTLDLGPAFTQIPEDNSYFCWNTGKYGKLVIYAPEAIFQDKNNFKLNTDATTSAISYTRGTINPKYRTEWIKEGTTIDTADANTPKIKIKLRGTTNTAVSANEYTSDVTSALSAGNIKVLIDGTDITDIVTKEVGTATQTTNAKTGAKDILQEVTLSNFAEISRRTGKNYIEWSGNITVEVAQKSLADKYGNKNITITDDGARADNTITDTTKVDKNTANAMFTDFIKPEFTYVYTDGNIDQTNKTLTVEFSVIDKYFDASTVINKKDGIIVKLLDADTQIPDANITKEITKIEDVTETREDSAEPVKIGEKYRLVIGGLQETDIATGAKYRNYSGPMSITFPEGIATDKSKNTNIAKTITIGVNNPTNTGTQQIVDVVDPMWKTENINIDKANKIVTVDLVGTDKYFDGTQTKLTADGIKVYIDENEVTSTENVTKQLSEGTELKEERTVNGTTTQVPYGVRYTLTLSNWPENDTTFNASGRTYREYSGTTKIEIPKGTLTDKYKNTSQAQTFTLGDIDFVKPEITKVSSTKGDSTETIIFNVIDKHLDTTKELNADDISVLVDKESASSVTKALTKLSDITATVNGTTKTIGQQYQLVLSNFKQERQSIDSSRNYTDWSGTVSIEIQEGAVQDTFENTNEKTTIDGDFVDFIEPEITYKYSNSDIDYTGKTFTMAIEVIDKYFAESSTLTTENLKNYLTIKVDGEDITDNDKITKEIIATENVLAGTVEKPINKTIDGKIQVGLTNQTVGKRYTLRISNLEQTIKTGEYLDYSGVITVALKAGIVKDTSDNRNVSTTISSGVDFPGGTGDGKIVDVVDPLWEQVGTATATPIKQTASIILKGTDKYLDKAKSKLTASQIKVLVNGQEQTSGITLEVTEDTSVSLTYGRQYKINVSGFVSNAYQVKLVVAANSLVDSSGNKSKEQEFILYSCLRKTDTETTATSPFLGNDKIQRQKVEKVILEDYANYTDDTRWDVSAQEDGSIIAWYETTPRNTYIVHIGSSIIMNGNENSSYLFAHIGYDSACAETSEESNPIIENIGLLHVDNVTNMEDMFYGFGFNNMKTFSLGKNFDVGAIQNVYEMFSYCGYNSMETLDLGEKFNPKSATNMQNMFAYCGYTAMTSLDLGDNFNTTTVTNMNGMFHHTGYMKMKKLDLGENFDTKNVTDMRYMFMSCGRNAMEALDLGDKFDTTKVTVYKEMFRGCGYQSMTRLDLGDNFNTSNGKDMSGMFQNCGVTAMTSLDLGDKFYTTSSTDMTNMFNGTGTTAMTTLDLGSGFTKIATKHDNMFTNCGNANLVVYSPELIYSNESAFKMGR